MIMIIFHHFADHGSPSGTVYMPAMVNGPRFYFNLIWMGGKLGVNVFIMISGYFLIAEKSESVLNLRKIIKFWSQLLFYGLLLYGVFKLIGRPDGGFAAAVLPVSKYTWWFASVYFVMFLLHPFLNRMLRSLTRVQYRRLLLILLGFWSVLPLFTYAEVYMNELLWFMTIYATAGYIRLFGLNPKWTRKHYIFGFVVFALIKYAVLTQYMLQNRGNAGYADIMRWLMRQSIIYVYAESVCLFMIFEKTNIATNKWINRIASTTFGIYLIHDSFQVRNVLWTEIFHVTDYKTTWLLVPYSVMAVILIFAVCAVIDGLRIQFIEKYWMKLVDRLLPYIRKPFEWIDKAASIVFGK